MSAFKWSHIRNTAAALALAASLSHGTVSTVGGNVQVVNLLNSSAQAGLDLTSVGTFIEIANFTVSQNTSSWEITFVFANGGQFKNSLHPTQVVNMTALKLVAGAGTLGAGPNEISAVACPAAAVNVTNITDVNHGGIWTASLLPGTAQTINWTLAAQTTPTIGHVYSLQASWGAASNVLAGLYTETVTATLTATL